MKTYGKKPDILFTGDRRIDRHEVRISGQPVWLQRMLFCAMLELARCAAAGARFVPLRKQVAYLLRQEIGKVVGLPAAKQLIQTAGTEYFLADSTKIGFCPMFRTIPARNPRMKRLMSAVRGAYPEIPQPPRQDGYW